MARPISGRYVTSDMVKAIDEYIADESHIIPILKECCLLNNWDYDYIMKLQRENDTLRQSIKKLLGWKEVKLESGALTGRFDKTMAIFSLKQPAHGWTDRMEVFTDPEKNDNKLFEAIQSSALEVWDNVQAVQQQADEDNDLVDTSRSE